MKSLTVALGISLAVSTIALAQTAPRTVAFNGVARDGSGKSVSGLRGMTFSIYADQAGGTSLWVEVQAVTIDPFGNYTVYLGATTPGGLPMELFTSGQARWLGVNIEGAGEQARVFLASVPYALKAADAETVGGLPVTSFVLVDDPSGAGSSLAGMTSTAAVPTNDSDVPTRDQVILDDLIVDGSICVGLDCVNGESFGFDTLRLKENNLRIKFQDTSTSASFPSNDWQLTINETSNGGANKFSIDDIDGGRTPFTIEAGAPTNSLYVDNGGRLGSRTNNPVVGIHRVDGNTPTLRLEQDGSSGFTAQTWDLASNEANFFIRDATNGSTLPFRIQPGAPTNAISIRGSGSHAGHVGFGTNAPTEEIHVTDSGSPKVLVDDTTENNDDKPGVILRSAGINDWNFELSNIGDFQVTQTGTGGAELTIANSTGVITLGNAASASSDVMIPNDLFVTGMCSGCDEVFEPGYPIETIDEHAAFMWKNSFLPGIGPTPVHTNINVFEKTAGILNELEKAHIYIEQLHGRLRRVESEKNGLQEAIGALLERVEVLEIELERER